MALDEARSAAFRAAGVPGGGGYGTAAALAAFYQMLAAGGALNGTRVLSPRVIAHATRNHTGDRVDDNTGATMNRGLGPVVRGRVPPHAAQYAPGQSRGMGTIAPPATFGHGGAGQLVLLGRPGGRALLLLPEQLPRRRPLPLPPPGPPQQPRPRGTGAAVRATPPVPAEGSAVGPGLQARTARRRARPAPAAPAWLPCLPRRARRRGRRSGRPCAPSRSGARRARDAPSPAALPPPRAPPRSARRGRARSAASRAAVGSSKTSSRGPGRIIARPRASFCHCPPESSAPPSPGAVPSCVSRPRGRAGGHVVAPRPAPGPPRRPAASSMRGRSPTPTASRASSSKRAKSWKPALVRARQPRPGCSRRRSTPSTRIRPRVRLVEPAAGA